MPEKACGGRRVEATRAFQGEVAAGWDFASNLSRVSVTLGKSPGSLAGTAILKALLLPPWLVVSSLCLASMPLLLLSLVPEPLFLRRIPGQLRLICF